MERGRQGIGVVPLAWGLPAAAQNLMPARLWPPDTHGGEGDHLGDLPSRVRLSDGDKTDVMLQILWPPDVRADSLEDTLMLGKIEGRRRSG